MPGSTRSFPIGLLGSIALLMLLAACSRLTMENYSKIQSGMSYAEVQAILGRASTCDEIIGVKTCRWGNDKRQVTVSFVSDQVMFSSAENVR